MSPGYLVKQASSALHVAMDAVLRPLGLTITEYSCLELLTQRPGLSNSELARGAFVSRQSMNVVLQALEHDGLISRAAQPISGRAIPTQLTAAGRARIREASAAVRSVEDRMTAALNDRQRADFVELLNACIHSLG